MLDYVQVPFTAAIAADPDSLKLMLPATTRIVLSDAESPNARSWAARQGIELVRAR
jgi:hypothetical protein